MASKLKFMATANGSTNASNNTGGTTYTFGSSKINSHLLDHGYGATPQPQSGTKNGLRYSMPGNLAAHTTDSQITNFYRVSGWREIGLRFRLNRGQQSDFCVVSLFRCDFRRRSGNRVPWPRAPCYQRHLKYKKPPRVRLI